MTVSEYLHYRKQAKGKDKPKEKGEGFVEILEKKIKRNRLPTKDERFLTKQIDNSICMHFTMILKK